MRGFVHVKCYSLYTHKKALAAISKQTPDLKSSSAESDSADDTAATEEASKRPFTSTHSKSLRDVCLFCQTKTKRRRRRAGEKIFGVRVLRPVKGYWRQHGPRRMSEFCLRCKAIRIASPPIPCTTARAMPSTHYAPLWPTVALLICSPLHYMTRHLRLLLA